MNFARSTSLNFKSSLPLGCKSILACMYTSTGLYVSKYWLLCIQVPDLYVSKYWLVCIQVPGLYVSKYWLVCIQVPGFYVYKYWLVCIQVLTSMYPITDLYVSKYWLVGIQALACCIQVLACLYPCPCVIRRLLSNPINSKPE